jgi:hypothetical protein
MVIIVFNTKGVSVMRILLIYLVICAMISTCGIIFCTITEFRALEKRQKEIEALEQRIDELEYCTKQAQHEADYFKTRYDEATENLRK